MTQEATSSQSRLGFLEAVAAAALWGSSGVFAVWLLELGVTPTSIAVIRMALGAMLLVLLGLVLWREELRMGGRDVLILMVGGGIPMAAFQVVYQLSIDAAGVPTTVALLYLAPVFVVAASAPLLNERPSLFRVVLSGVVVAGVWLTVLGAYEVESYFGERSYVWGILAGACYAGYTLFGRYASPRWGSIPTAVYGASGAALILVVTVPFGSSSFQLPTDGRAWVLLLVFALVTITLASLLFFDALKRIEASRVAVAAASEPVVAGLLATFVLSQGLRPVGWLGIAVVAAGVAAVGATERAETSGDSHPA